MKKIIIVLMILFCWIIAIAQDTIITDSFEEEGLEIIIDTIEASTYLKDNSGYNYEPFNTLDGKNETAWCVPNGGIGEWLKVNFSSKKHYYQYRNINVLELNIMDIINGLAASEQIYFANNRVKKIKVEFDNGTSQIIELKDGVGRYQRFYFNEKSRWVKLTILEIYKGKKYNDTCISKVNFFTSERRWKKKK